jgi:hypothetical protein
MLFPKKIFKIDHFSSKILFHDWKIFGIYFIWFLVWFPFPLNLSWIISFNNSFIDWWTKILVHFNMFFRICCDCGWNFPLYLFIVPFWISGETQRWERTDLSINHINFFTNIFTVWDFLNNSFIVFSWKRDFDLFFWRDHSRKLCLEFNYLVIIFSHICRVSSFFNHNLSNLLSWSHLFKLSLTLCPHSMT